MTTLTAGTRWLDRRTLMRFNIDFFSLLCYNFHKIIFTAREMMQYENYTF